MDLHQLTAISPIDGRYHPQVSTLEGFFSEYALIKYRVYVEIQYLSSWQIRKSSNYPPKTK
ncbi:hypothetical protein [Arachidicoccus ginsenosidivorans]|uniref:hypothetical protein n=1 Tax=Arachidicoccus ginsenosidivorans TaxID=496057 RepID=UPI001CEF7D0F|nr:hypothetical protein [Arachidicoccus ginsenosidivorans]